MVINFHIKEVIIGNKQKDLMEKKLKGLKKFVIEEPTMVDVYLRDETSQEKGGVDQSVEISVVFGKEKIFVKEVDDKLMRAFAYTYKAVERQMIRMHKRVIEKSRQGIKDNWKIWERLNIGKKREE